MSEEITIKLFDDSTTCYVRYIHDGKVLDWASDERIYRRAVKLARKTDAGRGYAARQAKAAKIQRMAKLFDIDLSSDLEAADKDPHEWIRPPTPKLSPDPKDWPQ